MVCEGSGTYQQKVRKLKRDDTGSRKYNHPIVCRILPEERELVSDMTLNMVALENILITLKQKKPLNVSNIKQIYNVHARDNNVVRLPRSEMQKLLKTLEDEDYVSTTEL
ncbi:unnamed protein product [Lathyrus sativus]|nr:unnamed protein product [Lathyrus sativus]